MYILIINSIHLQFCITWNLSNQHFLMAHTYNTRSNNLNNEENESDQAPNTSELIINLEKN